MSRIWVPRCKIIEPKDIIQLPSPVVKGRYQLRAVKRDGVTVDRESPWFDNLILNQGLDLMAASNTYLSHISVGTGTTAAAATDTAMEALVAQTSTSQSEIRATNASSPYEITSTVVRRFAQGAAAGNLTEVGIGTASTLFSRALIVDGGGSPTTFPVAADEFLDVAYQLIVYPPLADINDTISITGSGSHDIVARAALAGTGPTSGWYHRTGGAIVMQIDPTGQAVAYNGAIGALTAIPSGTSDAADSVSNSTYSAGTFTRAGSISFGLNDGNLSGGISAVRLDYGAKTPVSTSDRQNIAFQYSYSPAISKTSAQLLTLNFSITWARTP